MHFILYTSLTAALLLTNGDFRGLCLPGHCVDDERSSRSLLFPGHVYMHVYCNCERRPVLYKCVARVRPHKFFFSSGDSDPQDVDGEILNRQFRSFLRS